MQRRGFLGLAAGALAASSLPWRVSRAAESAAASPAVDLPAIGRKGQQLLVRGNDIAALRASLRGQVMLRGEAGYDVSRRV